MILSVISDIIELTNHIRESRQALEQILRQPEKIVKEPATPSHPIATPETVTINGHTIDIPVLYATVNGHEVPIKLVTYDEASEDWGAPADVTYEAWHQAMGYSSDWFGLTTEQIEKQEDEFTCWWLSQTQLGYYYDSEDDELTLNEYPGKPYNPISDEEISRLWEEKED
ncbi:hypothetical protein [Gloeothece verrucosa]|uniref:Uncharacterized protein n=1 Tax=Gloeothece verrucosa (strain PCC 7822) TaxID=497965 RepID=E0ULY3_GLOV7|nr:hypothetical protein [Gloeothece verrucosa]ADN17963.1 hypothetical protein Cyan7822_6130 [Gloeothece verrucosa PCC 7822]